MALDLLIRNTSKVVTSRDVGLGAVPRGVVGVTEGRVSFLGDEAALPPGSTGPKTRVIDAGGGFVGPGFVDPHTHLVFAGERAAEFDLRNQGATYVDIGRAGGGIMSTVRATRAASEDELVELALPRLARMLEQGITCVEVKSGYGLTCADELKMLAVVKKLQALQPVTLVPTLMCAHAVPEEHRAHRDRYVDLCVQEIIPAAAAQGVARFCDVFVEDGAFTADEARKIAAAARAHGLAVRLHVDQLSGGSGALLAAELSATSADHLEQVTEEGARALAAAGVSAVLAPVSTLYLHVRPPAPGRLLLKHGVNVALATNLNPGSAMSDSVSLTLGLACLLNGLTAAEAYHGFTRAAGLALGLPEAGMLAVGGPADLVLFRVAGPEQLAYRLAMNEAQVVVKAGQVVVPPLAAGVW